MTSGLMRLPESKSFPILVFILITVSFGCTAFASSAVHESEAPCILILHSYEPEFTWTQNISAGLHSILDEADFEIDYHIEYMDTKFHIPEVLFPQLEQLYRAKYEGCHFDLIITIDDNALNFLLPRRDLLFPGVPIVFCGLNNYTESRVEGIQGITGVAEAIDLVGTIELALDLHPGTRYVAVVNDNTPTGMWNLQGFRSVSSVFTDRIEFIELFNLTTEELIESLHALPDETVILLLSFYLDQAGRAFSYQEYTVLVTENCDVPVYTAWDMFVGYGVIGGIVTSGMAQGEHAARLALRVLDGESADDIPVLTESPNVPMFDYNVLQRFGISVSDLPVGRVVVNEPVSLYYRHKTFIWMASAFVLLQSVMILALTINVLRRKRAEGKLRQSEARYRGIVEDQTELICRNLPDGTLTFVNDAYCRYFRRSRDELTGQSFMPLIPEEHHQAVKDYFASLGNENPVATHEYRIVMPDGESRWNQWTNRAILNNDGEVIEFQGAGRDITERKHSEQEQRNLERQVLHAQKLESLGILAGGIAHDFNNLLTGILGNADLALFDLPPESPVRQNIQDIETTVLRAAELCQQMLAYSGKGHITIEPVDLSEIVREMSHILEVSINKKAVLEYKLAENPAIIMADATQIRQVIMNLITNASDAIIDMSGVISISTGLVLCDSSHLYVTYTDEYLREGVYAFLEVTDSGCGMDDSTKQKLFDPFFSTKVEGRGLGLSSVQGIVRGHKGVLKVYSEPGNGTTFRILLPAYDKSTRPITPEKDGQEEWIGHGTVLLADDEEIIRKVGRCMLERLGLSVILAVDGHEAVEIFRARHNEIDCVLLDLTMPNMNGEEAFREMKRIRKDVRVILSSGYSEQEVSRRFAGKDLFGFIQKPYVLKVLQKAIREALNGETT